MPRFRKKALEVEAVQWTGENREEVEAVLRDSESASKCSVNGSIKITRALGSELVAVVRPGHWLIRRRANGPLSTQPPEHFEATYEPADQPGQGVEGDELAAALAAFVIDWWATHGETEEPSEADPLGTVLNVCSAISDGRLSEVQKEIFSTLDPDPDWPAALRLVAASAQPQAEETYTREQGEAK